MENVPAIHAPARRNTTQFAQPTGLHMEIRARLNVKMLGSNAKENVHARDAKTALSTICLFVPQKMSLMETCASRNAVERKLSVQENVPVNPGAFVR